MKLSMTLMATSCLTLTAAMANADGHMASEMTIVSWGGAYSSSQQNAYHDPYMEKTGVTIINDESSAIRLCDEGLALEIDADTQLADGDDGSKASDDFGDLLVSDCFIPQIVYSTTVGYRTDLVGDTAPTEICALFDTEAYPGKRSLEKRPINNMEWALLLLWDAQVFDLDGWIIPTGLSPEREARALDYVKFATDTQRLADQAKYISYGPARKSSAPLVGKHASLGIEMAPHMPTDPENAKNTFLYNYEWWADYRDDLDAKFQAWLSQ